MRLVPLLSALLAAPTLASDGALEINQACATSAAGCFPGDIGGGFPVEITATEQSYRLTSSLQVPSANTTAIQVIPTNANVTIDLNGFTIRGVTVCSGIPITTCNPTGTGVGVSGVGAVHVRNGFITQMGSDGVSLGYSGSVENVRALLNGGDGVRGGDGILVRGSAATSNGGDGIDLNIEAVVSNCLANGNKGVGIRVNGGNVEGNVASRNGQQGAFLGTTTAFRGNQLTQNSPSLAGGRATGGNVCDDGRCNARGARRFYLTTGVANGANALNACVQGFHMASLWELFDLSTLSYDTNLGFTAGDSGGGPSNSWGGWIRTGAEAETDGSFGPGFPNCDVWRSSSSGDFGSGVALSGEWSDADPHAGTAPWLGIFAPCDYFLRTWCVED
jgi:hypothetical protein